MPGFLVEPRWLQECLGDENLFIFDCTTTIVPDPKAIYTTRAELGRFEAGHIPGAQFIDVQADISDPSSPWHFMLPTPAAFEAAMRRFGLGAASRVVLYSTGDPWWATRVWWTLRVFGFDRVAVLDGGWRLWQTEGRPVEKGPARARSAGDFRATYRAELVADRADVLDAIGPRQSATVVSARQPSQFAGVDGNSYGRPGRIAGSVNVPAASLIDPASGRFRPAAELAECFSALPADVRLILYCGHGVAASADAFALAMLGRGEVRVYDASLSEWAKTDDLPMAVD